MSVLCEAKPCPVILDAACVFYEGANLIYTGINTNESLQVALQKIDAKFGDAAIGYIFTNGISQSAPGQPVKLGGTLIQDTTITSNTFWLKITGDLEAGKHITTGGTSAQFVKGDGTLDGTSYQPAGAYISALTGDGTASGPGSAVFTLATVNPMSAGTWGSSTQVPIITVNAKGLVTNITSTLISVPSNIISISGPDMFGSGVTGVGFSVTLSTVNPNVYGSKTPLKFTVTGKGLVTSAAPITNLDLDAIYGYTPVPSSRTLTINGVTYDLSSNRSWTITTTAGTSGSSGTSGINGTSGSSGTTGTSGSSGSSGIDGTSGSSGTSGFDGTSGTDGSSGTSGSSGSSGINGSSGSSGSSGTGGSSGSSGSSGSAGSSGTSGNTGSSGSSGSSGTTGSSGTSGTSATSGSSGTTGTSGSSGVSGSSGSSGTTGTSGSSGSSGSSGANGSSGTSGANGSSGTSGSSGSSGTSGNNGSSGTSGGNGSSGTSGSSGSSGINGSSGSSGTSGNNGSSGTSGNSGSSGTSGVNGSSGTSVSVSGTTNYVVKFTGATTIGNSQIFDNGTSVGINTATPSSSFRLDVVGDARATNITASSTFNGQDYLYAGALRVHGTGATGTVSLLTNSNTRLHITNGGNVIINNGTTDAGYKLDAYGNSRIYNGTLTVATASNSGYTQTYVDSTVGGGIKFAHTNGTVIGRIEGDSGGGINGLDLYAYDSFRFKTLNTTINFIPSTATNWYTYNSNFNFVGYTGFGGEVIMKNRADGTEVFHAYLADTYKVTFPSGNVGIGTISPNASAVLDATSTTKGFLPPRMTTAQKNAITSPATGLVVYDTTLNKLCVYTGAGWETVTSV